MALSLASVDAMSMNKRIFIAACAPICIAVMWLAAQKLKDWSLFAVPVSDSPDARMEYYTKWLLIPGCCLLAGIMTMGCQRFVSGHGISGTRSPEWHSMEVNIRYNLNSMEQALLAAFAWLGLSVKLEHKDLWLIGLFATFFAVGRVLFWIGYMKEGVEELRAPGMLLTVIPTVGSFIWLVHKNWM